MPTVFKPRRILFSLLFASAAIANEATAPHGMVASNSNLATDAGVAALKNGGNAIDAAVTTALTLGVVQGYHSGIGGGCFMLIHTKDGQTIALDGREMAPAAATPNMYIRDGKGDPKLSQVGSLASGVPGSLAVYDYAVKTFGKKTLADALKPGETFAADGFEVPSNFTSATNDVKEHLAKFPSSAAIFLPDGKPAVAGSILKQPDLAKTYNTIATKGIGYFYKDGFPQQVEAWMKANDGIVTAADFAGYQMKQREPVVTQYRGCTVVGMPPPSSGGVHVAQILNILSNFDIAELEKNNPADRVHVISEAMRLAFADRAFWLGDPDFVKVPRGLLNADYAKGLADQIKPGKVLKDAQHGTPPDSTTDFFGKHTTHVSVADDEGNWVAITATVNTYFGSKVVIPGTGVIMNNQMDDFSIQAGVPNAFGLVGADSNLPGPGKRPLSSMSPTIVMKNNKPFLSIGAAGGPTIITQVMLNISNIVDLGDDLNTAMNRPRFHHQWFPEKMRIENTFPQPVLDALTKEGHELDVRKPAGATNAVMQNADGQFVGVSEPRIKTSKAAGE
ncbi:MAG: gamma-glutamyltransferase [Tepidisphaeraceae bacterium]